VEKIPFSVIKKVFGVESKEEWIDYLSQNLCTMGGNNHFQEVQTSDTGEIWLMIHTGSRNVGYRIANYYNDVAINLCQKWHSNISDKSLAFLPDDSEEGMAYLRCMKFALYFAEHNRKYMMEKFKIAFLKLFSGVSFEEAINIHHNFASLENHFGENVWVHRKGATSAKVGQLGIIPGSMGTSSYIVKGKGNLDSYSFCSHGAGRKMGRMDASRTLSKEDCDKAMDGIIFDGFTKMDGRKGKKEDLFDLGESPLAYKDIDTVIKNQTDLVDPIVKLSPLGVLKG
jgi:tRNA-splicing ligase RtcB